MNVSKVHIAAAMTTVLLTACVTQPNLPAPVSEEKSPPAYLTASQGCAVLIGGDVGSKFTDAKAGALWSKINAAITDELYTRLAERRYKVVKTIVSTDQVPAYQKLVVETLARNKCNRLLQISHIVDEDVTGKYFTFQVQLLKFEVNTERRSDTKGTATTTVGEYLKRYRYTRSKQTFDNFYTGTFAQEALNDLEKSGALFPIR